MKKEAGEIKAIVFDIGGVLELSKSQMITIGNKTNNFGVHNRIARKLKISIDQWFDAIDTAYAKSIEGKISEAKFLSIVSKNLKINPNKLRKIIIKAFKKNFKRNRKLYKIAFKLRKKGYKIAILSDQWWLSKRALISPKLMKKFNVVVISCDVGLRKPNIKIYKLLMKKLKMKSEEILFIDNQIWNTKPADALGMKTILFKNNKQTIRDLKGLGVL